MTSQMEKLCAQKRVKVEAQYGGVEVPEGWMPGTHPYKVTLRMERRRLTVPFFQGPAHTSEPTAADVLSCLVSDASSFESARSFEEWCGDLGYDTDSRKAERTYKACGDIAHRLRVFLGPHFEEFSQAEH